MANETAAPASGPGHDPPPSSAIRREGATAFRNALKLGASLMLTWGVALVITFKLPKYLGPVRTGWYNYGLEYAATLAVFVGLGVDTYISREVAVRPKHASDFFGGVFTARALLMIPIFLFGWFNLQSKNGSEQVAALLFGVTQIFMVMNQTFQATLQASSKVGGLAIANVVSKLLWGGGTFAAVALKVPFWVLPLPMLASEALKAAFLFWATREAVGMKLRVDWSQTVAVLKVSLPFFVANAAVTLGSKIDVVILRELVEPNSPEVGWYSSAHNIARLSALMSPVLSGVLVPMMSRAKHRSEQEFFTILRRGIEGVNVISIPLTLMIALGADFWIRIALKEEFMPATESLRWLAPTFVLAYGNVLLWVALMILGRSWTITVVSFLGLALLPILILTIVPLTRGEPGTTGMGVAIALSSRELVVILVFLAVLGRRALDRRSVVATLTSFAICGVVVLLHLSLARFGPARLAADALVYGVLALVFRVVRPTDIRAVLRLIKDRKRAQA